MTSLPRTDAIVSQKIAGYVAIVISLVSLVLGVIYQNHLADVTSCQTRINQEFLAVIKERAELNNENTANINKLIVEAFSASTKTIAERKAEGQAYLTELDRINGELAKATFPSLSSC